MRFLFLLFLLFPILGCNQEKVVDDRPKPPMTEEQQRYVEGEIIVRFEDTFTEPRIMSMLKTHGASIKQKLPGTQQYLIKLPFGHTVRNAVPLYNGLIGVKWAEPNYIFRAMGVSKQPSSKPADAKPVKITPIKIRKVQ